MLYIIFVPDGNNAICHKTLVDMKQSLLPEYRYSFWAKKFDEVAHISKSDSSGVECGKYGALLGNNYSDDLPVCPKCLKKIKAFEISSYNISDDIITVGCQKGTKELFVKVSKDMFETFLLGQDKLDWELNNSDERGDHIQTTGRMSVEEYWEGDMAYIYQDLYEYVTFHPIAYHEMVMQDSTESILKALNS